MNPPIFFNKNFSHFLKMTNRPFLSPLVTLMPHESHQTKVYLRYMFLNTNK